MIIEWLHYIFQFLLINDFLQIILKYFDVLIENLTNNNFFYNIYNYNNYNEDPNIWSKFNKSNYEKWHYQENHKTFLDLIYEETMQKVKARKAVLTVDEFLKQQHFLINSQNYNDLIKLFDYIDPYTKQKYNKFIDILSTKQCYFLVNEQLIIFKKMYIYNYTGSFYIENLYTSDSNKTFILIGFIIIFLACFKTYTG